MLVGSAVPSSRAEPALDRLAAAAARRAALVAAIRLPGESAVAAFIFITGWIVAIANPSILSLIESLAGPVIAVILYLMPMYAIHRIPALAPYRGKASNVFVTVAGLVAVTGIVYGLVP